MAIQSVSAATGFPSYRRASAEGVRPLYDEAAEPVPRRSNMPVERVIEGEVLERGGRAGAGRNDFLERFLMAGHAASQGGTYQADAAIGAYLGNRQLDEALMRQDSRNIDYYA